MREREGGELLREEAMEGGRDGEREMEIDRERSNKNNYLLQRFDICRTHPPSENMQLQHPIKFGGGQAQFSISAVMHRVIVGKEKHCLLSMVFICTFLSYFKWFLLMYNLIVIYNRFKDKWERGDAGDRAVTSYWRAGKCNELFPCWQSYTSIVCPPFANNTGLKFKCRDFL